MQDQSDPAFALKNHCIVKICYTRKSIVLKLIVLYLHWVAYVDSIVSTPSSQKKYTIIVQGIKQTGAYSKKVVLGERCAHDECNVDSLCCGGAIIHV